MLSVEAGQTKEVPLSLQETNLQVPSQSTVCDWCHRFREGRVSLEDDIRPGRPCTFSTPENVNVIQQIVLDQPRFSIRKLTELNGLSYDVVRRILTVELGLRKVCSVWIPHTLSEKNKLERITCAQEILQLFENHSLDYLMKHWATQDESWFLYETALTKEQTKPGLKHAT